MAGSVNKVILVGNLGADPEVRRLNSGEPVVNLRIATSESWRDKNSGERQERTEWHNVVIFNENLAKVAENYLKKGAKVYVEGQLQTRKWTDQNGVTHFSQDPPTGEQYEERDVREPPIARKTAEEEAKEAEPKPESDLCQRVRANIKTLEESQEVRMDLNGDGEVEVLDEAQRASQLDIARKQVDIYCRPQPPQPPQP